MEHCLANSERGYGKSEIICEYLRFGIDRTWKMGRLHRRGRLRWDRLNGQRAGCLDYPERMEDIVVASLRLKVIVGLASRA